MQLREWRRNSCVSEPTPSELEVVNALAEYMAYVYAARGNRETTITGNSIAVNFVNEEWVERSLLLDDFKSRPSRKE